MRRAALIAAGFFLPAFGAARLFASAGTSAASFLDIPVGAGPAAMGSAYSALATDAYAPTWNPAGLGLFDSYEAAFQHLSYLDSTHYEYASFGAPIRPPFGCSGSLWCGASGIGGSIQYFGSGDITGLDHNAQPTGDFSSHYAAYNMSYGRAFGQKLSLGLTGKLINAQLSDVSANAFAMDFGSLYQLKENVELAGTLMNVGGKLTFLNEGDPLPLAFHLGGAWQPRAGWNTSSEFVIPRTGLASFRFGGEWSPDPLIALRVGYRTDVLKGLSPLAGFSTGIGINAWGQELAYAWVPYGDLGDTQYLSILIRFGEAAARKRNLIYYSSRKDDTSYRRERASSEESESDELMQLLTTP